MNSLNFNKKSMEQLLPEELIIPTKDKDLIKWYIYIKRKLNSNGKDLLSKRIISYKICFLNFLSPACNIPNLRYKYKHVIMIDVEVLKKVYNENIEVIFPILLHELGHLFNHPKVKNLPTNLSVVERELIHEFYADDFVRKLRFVDELLKGLEIWKENNGRVNNYAIELRIKRIKDGAPIKKGINIETYNKKNSSRDVAYH